MGQMPQAFGFWGGGGNAMYTHITCLPPTISLLIGGTECQEANWLRRAPLFDDGCATFSTYWKSGVPHVASQCSVPLIHGGVTCCCKTATL